MHVIRPMHVVRPMHIVHQMCVVRYIHVVQQMHGTVVHCTVVLSPFPGYWSFMLAMETLE